MHVEGIGGAGLTGTEELGGAGRHASCPALIWAAAGTNCTCGWLLAGVGCCDGRVSRAPGRPSPTPAPRTYPPTVVNGAVEVRPALRGWLHAGMVPASLAGGGVLLWGAPAGWPKATVGVYAATSLLLFGVSALYHRRRWSPRVRLALKRWDHANIYLLIAGSDTATFGLVLRGGERSAALVAVWVAATVGAVFRVLRPDAPRWVYTPLYALLGWGVVVFLPQVHRSGGPAVVALMLTGGVAYTVGGLVYALRRPDPRPRIAGFHEIFHGLTVVGWGCGYLAVALLTLDRH